MTLSAIVPGTALSDLDAWGTVADLGSTLLEGTGQAYGRVTHGAPTDAVHAAYFGVTRSRFRMVYPFNEQATVVSGSVRLTDEATGESRTYATGESWLVTRGTAVLWEVLSDEGFVKHYLAVA